MTYQQKYYQENKDKIKARSLKRYQSNKEDVQIQHKEYRTTDKGKKALKTCRDVQKKMRAESTERVKVDGKYFVPWDTMEELQAITMKDEEGKTYIEISKILGRTIKSVEYKITQLRKKAKDERDRTI